MNKKKLVLGPWVGEFGWEVSQWNSLCRSVSEGYSDVMYVGEESKFYLYSDFCNDKRFVSFGESERNMWKCKNNRSSSEILMSTDILYGESNYDIFDTEESYRRLVFNKERKMFCNFNAPFSYKNKIFTPKYRMFGEKSKESAYDVVIHARNRFDIRTEDNWPKKKWEILVKRLRKHGFSVSCIGSKSESLFIEGCANYISRDLEDVCDMIRSSSLFLGPQSGPTHLAAFCGASQVVWSPKEYNRYRCEVDWNPFGSNVIFIADRNPTVDEIFKASMKILV